MTKVIAIGEKSSQIKKFAAALFSNTQVEKISKYIYLRSGIWNDYDITFIPLVGHITQIDTASDYGWGKCEPRQIMTDSKSLVWKQTRQYVKLIRRLAKDADELWLATDPDAEGDNIAYEAFQIAVKSNPKLKKATRRVWNASLTKAEILRSFNNLREWDESLALGVQGRRIVDAYVGFAGTRELTRAARQVGGLEGKSVMSVGRVQLPTLKMIVDKDREINAFKPQTHYNLIAQSNSLVLKHILCPFTVKKEMMEIYNDIKLEKSGLIHDFTVKQLVTKPPKPLNTTDALALLATQMKINAEQGLKFMAELYEEGYLSYPRTDNRKFQKDFPHKPILEQLREFGSLVTAIDTIAPNVVQVRNNGTTKEGTEDHDPIFPTGKIAVEGGKITNQHCIAWEFLTRYYIAMFMPDLLRDRGLVTVKIKIHNFVAEYQTITDAGWTESAVWMRPKTSMAFSFEKGNTIPIIKIEHVSFKTKPPRRWSAASILKALEKARIGTKSSRPDVLAKLEKRGYIKRTRTTYEALPNGLTVIELLEGIWPDLVSSTFTRFVEEKMDDVATKKSKFDDMVTEMATTYLELHDELIGKLPDFQSKVRQSQPDAGQQVACPKCGTGIMVARKNRKTGETFYGCSRYPQCKTAVSSLDKIKVKENE